MRRCSAIFVIILVVGGAVAAGSDASGVKRWGAYGSTRFDQDRVPTAVSIPQGHGVTVKIDAGNAASYALSSDGTLWAFGKNSHGELGNGTTEPSMSPVAVTFPAATTITAVGEGDATGFAVDSTGQAWSWGSEQREEGEGPAQSLCLGRQTGDVLTPRKVPGLTGVRAVQAGATHVIWLMQDGTVETCGANYLGQLGIGNSGLGMSYVPVKVPGLSDVVEVSAGQATTCARTAGGEVYVWGGDLHGQVGNGVEEETGVFSPFHVPLPAPASDISCGGNYRKNGSTLALAGGVLYGWGDDEKGQLGDGQTTNKASPAVATDTLGLKLTQVITSGAYSLGVNAAGNVYGWGWDYEFTIATRGQFELHLEPLLIDTGALEVSGTAFDSLER
jgi:alpha-tubulin suppressor-like RCC1 family protein